MTELQIGFIPLLDCAPLAVAREKGFAAAEGLSLSLVRESSWANIRDRLVVGHFDAAHMLGPMTVASTLGIRHIAVPVIAPLALGYGGNAITVSIPLEIELLREQHQVVPGGDTSPPARMAGEALRRVVAARASEGKPPLTFGMVYPFSCHNYELRYWLAASGIDPDRDARLVVIPPPLLVDAMRSGHIDGFCVGEPWNSVAVEAGVGAIVLATTSIWRYSPEKVLGMRGDFAERRPDAVTALVRAVWRASLWCADEANRPELARMLSHPKYVGAPMDLLERALANRLVARRGAECTPFHDFHEPVGQPCPLVLFADGSLGADGVVRRAARAGARDVPARPVPARARGSDDGDSLARYACRRARRRRRDLAGADAAVR
jgi:ABC-type nitrate/sulfonate/bicarbonate transport system substrate-binding protein